MNIGTYSDTDEPTSWKVWILFLALAILLHLLFFAIPVDWNATELPKKVEIEQVDSKKVEAIRKQWKKQSQKLLLNHDDSKPKETEAPPNARYFSDRNTSVEKEQQARQTQVMPQDGGLEGANVIAKKTPPKSSPQRNLPKLGALSSLGVPFRLDAPQTAHVPDSNLPDTLEKQSSREPLIPRGGDQNIDDPNLPMGAENILNTQQNLYYSFYARLHEAIAPLWLQATNEIPPNPDIQAGEYVTVLEIILDEQGDLKAVNQVRSSTLVAFDKAAIAPWWKIARFPNPPRALLDANRLIHLYESFKMTLSQDKVFIYHPPRRY